MKIIRYVTLSPSCSFDFHPDSALLLPGRPMFYPDFGGSWIAEPMLAVRLNRLGKSIAPQFAGRYYDALALAIRIRPLELDPASEGEFSGMDCSITHGDWLAPHEFLGIGTATFGDISVAFPDKAGLIDAAVSRASRHTTVKMGDIVLLPLKGTSDIPLTPRSRLIATTPTSHPLLNVKVV